MPDGLEDLAPDLPIAASSQPQLAQEADRYHPLADTVRLYAAWLFACLFVVVLLGAYQNVRSLPVHVPLIQEWVESAVILDGTAVTFLLLLVGSVHAALGRGLWKGILLTLVGFVLFVFFRINT